MVDKKALNAVNRNEIVLIILVLGFIGFVFATTSFDGSLVNQGNYSTSLFLNITTNTTGNAQFNMTCFYNSSGGVANTSTSAGFASVGNLTGILANQTAAGDVSPFNISVDLSLLSDSITTNVSCFLYNGSVIEVVSENVTIDKTAPGVNFTGTTGSSVVNYGNYTSATAGNVLINVSASDAIFGANHTEVYINVTNSDGGGGSIGANFTRALNRSAASVFYNASINVTNFPDGVYNFTIYANDTNFNNFTAGTYTNLNNTESLQITLDNTAPSSVTLAKANSTRSSLGIDVTIVDAGSGIGTVCTVVGTGGSMSGTTTSQTLVATGLGCSSTYAYVVTCTDRVGYSKASISKSFITDSCSGGPSGSTPTVEDAEQYTWASITPETPALMGDFEEDLGVNQIRVEVKNEVNNARLIVSRYGSNPSTVTITQSEKIYRYLEIEARNLGEDLERATIRMQVAKTWTSENDFTKEEVMVFRIEEAGTEWEELASTYLEEEEDDNYYYYDVDVTSFSYFAIGGKLTEEPEPEPEPEPANLLWLWITIGAVVLVIIVGGGFAAKKRR